MHPLGTAGIALSVIGFAGYVGGIVDPYPGRAFSLTLVMAGVTLFLVGQSQQEDEG